MFHYLKCTSIKDSENDGIEISLRFIFLTFLCKALVVYNVLAEVICGPFLVRSVKGTANMIGQNMTEFSKTLQHQMCTQGKEVRKTIWVW